MPTLQDAIFSLKTFAAAMLALYVAFSLDLPRAPLGDADRLHRRPAALRHGPLQGRLPCRRNAHGCGLRGARGPEPRRRARAPEPRLRRLACALPLPLASRRHAARL